MPKVLLVEDDNNLREIFEMRLQAEGYKTVSASDGEEALTVAMKEKPDLIIADVMMPRLSGFEMLETLRAAPELKDTKVIMMTALGQAEDRARGEKLGVVKYLVKSQVTLEDFVSVVREVLPSGQETAANTEQSPDDSDKTNAATNNKQESEKSMPEDNQTPTNPPAAQDGPAPADNPISGAPSLDSSTAGASDAQSSAQEQNTVQNQVNDFVASTPADTPAVDTAPAAGDMSAPATPAAPADPVAPASDATNPVSDQPANGIAPAANPTDAGSAGSGLTEEHQDVPVTPAPEGQDNQAAPGASDQPAGGDTTSPSASSSL